MRFRSVWSVPSGAGRSARAKSVSSMPACRRGDWTLCLASSPNAHIRRDCRSCALPARTTWTMTSSVDQHQSQPAGPRADDPAELLLTWSRVCRSDATWSLAADGDHQDRRSRLGEWYGTTSTAWRVERLPDKAVQASNHGGRAGGRHRTGSASLLFGQNWLARGIAYVVPAGSSALRGWRSLSGGRRRKIIAGHPVHPVPRLGRGVANRPSSTSRVPRGHRHHSQAAIRAIGSIRASRRQSSLVDWPRSSPISQMKLCCGQRLTRAAMVSTE